MPKLPQVSGNKLIKFLQSIEYIIIRQKGSHVTLRKSSNIGNHNITLKQPVDGYRLKVPVANGEQELNIPVLEV